MPPGLYSVAGGRLYLQRKAYTGHLQSQTGVQKVCRQVFLQKETVLEVMYNFLQWQQEQCRSDHAPSPNAAECRLSSLVRMNGHEYMESYSEAR